MGSKCVGFNVFIHYICQNIPFKKQNYCCFHCSRFQRQSSEPCFGSLPGGAGQRPFHRQNSEPSFLLFKQQQSQPGHPFNKPYSFPIKEEMPDFGYENNGKHSYSYLDFVFFPVSYRKHNISDICVIFMKNVCETNYFWYCKWRG